MNRSFPTLGLALGLACALSLPACQTSKAGVTNTFGRLHGHVAADPDDVTAAAEDVVRELELDLVRSTATKVDGLVEARTAKDKLVRIESESAGIGVTELSIRVGTSGDEALSLRIWELIQERLGDEGRSLGPEPPEEDR
jgi:hypothetical protein